MWVTQVWSLGREDPLEKKVANHSSVLAWRIPWMEEPGGLQCMESRKSQTHFGTKQQHIWLCCSWCNDLLASLLLKPTNSRAENWSHFLSTLWGCDLHKSNGIIYSIQFDEFWQMHTHITTTPTDVIQSFFCCPQNFPVALLQSVLLPLWHAHFRWPLIIFLSQ